MTLIVPLLVALALLSGSQVSGTAIPVNLPLLYPTECSNLDALVPYNGVLAPWVNAQNLA